MTDRTAQEIEAEIAEKHRQLAALELELANTTPAIDAPFRLPGPEHMQRLMDVALDARAELRAAVSPHDNNVAMFSGAFRFISTLSRCDDLDMRNANSYWTNEAETWLRARGASVGSVRTWALYAAAIAAGAVAYTLGNYPHEAALAVVLGSRPGSRPATNAWVHTLRGDARAPVPANALPRQPRSDAAPVGIQRRHAGW